MNELELIQKLMNLIDKQQMHIEMQEKAIDKAQKDLQSMLAELEMIEKKANPIATTNQYSAN